MAWLLLIVAGLCEIAWAIGLKYAEGFTRFWPSVMTVVAMLVSIVLLGYAMKSLPVGTSYAVWVGSAQSGPRFSVSCCSANRQARLASRASGLSSPASSG